MSRFLSALVLTLTLLAGTALAGEKTYIVASDATWPPMEFLDADKKVIGYSADYINAVAKEAGIAVEVRNIAWDGIFAGVAAGNYDIIASSVTITPERQKQFGFSDPYCAIHQALVVRADADIQSLDQTKGKKVGGQIGTTGIFVMEKAKTGATLKEYEDIGLAMEDLANGRIDAVVCDDPIAKYYANKKEDFANKFKIALVTPEVEYYGFTVQKGNEELIKLLNTGIKLVREKGIEKELQAKWMGE